MKTFKSAKWDMDAETDSFQELFQKPKKKKIEIFSNKKKLKNMGNKFKTNVSLAMKNLKTDKTVNLIHMPISSEKVCNSKKRRLKKLKTKDLLKSSQNDIHDSKLQNIKKQKQLMKLAEVVSNKTSENVKDTKRKKEKFKNLKLKLKEKVSEQFINTDNLKLAYKKQKNTNGITEISVKNKKKQKNKRKPKSLLNYMPDESPTSHTEESSLNSPSKLDKSLKEQLLKVKKLKKFKKQSLAEKKIFNQNTSFKEKKKEQFFVKLKDVLQVVKEEKPTKTLRQKMMERLQAARFRFINEQIYTTDSKEAQKIFQNDPDAFRAYHDGYRKQVKSWPVNPLDVIIDSIKKMPKTHVVSDFGCGDAKLSKSVVQKVYSFDLVAADDTVIAGDMSKVPLENNSVDVAVFCLSLMGTNLKDYLIEANRVLKIGGILKIAEVESRFEKIEDFIKGVHCFGFKSTWNDLSHNLFYFLDFKKERDVKKKNKLPTIELLPCLYKKR